MPPAVLSGSVTGTKGCQVKELLHANTSIYLSVSHHVLAGLTKRHRVKSAARMIRMSSTAKDPSNSKDLLWRTNQIKECCNLFFFLETELNNSCPV